MSPEQIKQDASLRPASRDHSEKEGPWALASQNPFPSSRTLSKLFTSLSAAQGLFPLITKKNEADAGGKFSYTYADLGATIQATKEILSANKLCVTQILTTQEGAFGLLTVLGHESGEWISSFVKIQSGLPPQQLGSALTYMRRYSYGAILGLSTEEDDDGAKAQADDKEKAKTQNKKPQAAATPKKEISPKDYVVNFGPFKGKKIVEVAFEDLNNYSLHIQSETQKDPKKATPSVKLFLEMAGKILAG